MAVNLCIFLGNLGDDVEVRNLPSGDTVANFRIAVTEKWNNSDGEKSEHTEWIRCSAFGGLADVIADYFKKGSEIHVTGKWRTRKWTDNNDVEHHSTELRVESFSFTGGSNRDGARDSRDSDRGGRSNDRGGRGNGRGNSGNRNSNARGRGDQGGGRSGGGSRNTRDTHQDDHDMRRSGGSYGNGGFDEFDDDIPF